MARVYIQGLDEILKRVEIIKDQARLDGGKCQKDNCYCRVWIGNRSTDPDNHRWRTVTAINVKTRK